ncbi:hypothetical protein QYE76_047477 [Lolium multiflorum]|uniref:Transposon protein, putative, CACTA, En/Spm sub-class n=1 Tax=Lolium multiflorum TaxID=4521 RepID=A0AAD8X085_LOLMU|nr:hypothetical protein QYE76_047477 [Lolium multiflorum]
MHLLRHGFMPSYNCWTKHGERGVIMEEDEEGDDFIDESYLAHFGDTFMEDAEGEGEGEAEGEEEARDDPVDDLGRTIADARRRCETEKERENLDRMLEDHMKALYSGCDDGLKNLGCTLDLLKWKAQAGVADSAFENLLKMLKNMFPKNNELPATTYEAKKVVCPLGLEVLKIHACINDCILYRGEYENLNECPVCTALRYKIRGDDPGDDVEGQKPRKRVPAKVMCFELVFPPSFFNIMTHLLVHLVDEISILGPVFLHNMFPFERFMGILKKYVRNRARPEGSIAKGYGNEEAALAARRPPSSPPAASPGRLVTSPVARRPLAAGARRPRPARRALAHRARRLSRAAQARPAAPAGLGSTAAAHRRGRERTGRATEKKQRGFHGGLTGWCTDDRNSAPEPRWSKLLHRSLSLPVDDIKEMKACHLYYPIGNMSMKVAIGGALPPGALHHNNPIQDGYARVTVEEIVQGFEDLDIDIATPKG